MILFRIERGFNRNKIISFPFQTIYTWFVYSQEKVVQVLRYVQISFIFWIYKKYFECINIRLWEASDDFSQTTHIPPGLRQKIMRFVSARMWKRFLKGYSRIGFSDSKKKEALKKDKWKYYFEINFVNTKGCYTF